MKGLADEGSGNGYCLPTDSGGPTGCALLRGLPPLCQLQATGWSLNGSLEGGFEWASPGSAHRIRALVVAQRGALPFSQFFSEETENVGVQLQFEF